MNWTSLSPDEDLLVWRWRARNKSFERIAVLLRARRAQVIGKRHQWAKINRDKLRAERAESSALHPTTSRGGVMSPPPARATGNRPESHQRGAGPRRHPETSA